MDSVDGLHGVSLDAGSPGGLLESLVSDSLHRVHGFELSGANRCSLCMNGEPGVRGVQTWNRGYIHLINRRTVFASGAGWQIRSSPWVKSALLKNGKKSWEDSRSLGQSGVLPEF